MSGFGFGFGFGLGLARKGFDPIPEYSTLLAAMSTQPPDTLKVLQNNLAKTLIDAGIWAKGDRLFVFENHTNNGGEALLNWLNPAQSATNSGAVHKPYFGMVPNGTSTYVNSGFSPTVGTPKFVRDSSTFLFYSRKRVWQHIGGGSASSRTSIQQGGQANPSAIINSATFLTTAAAQQHGFYAATRNGAAGQNLFINSLAKITMAGASTAPVNYNFHVCGALNLAGTLYYNNAPVSVVFIGSYLTDAEVAIFRDAIETYIAGNDANNRILTAQIASVNVATKQKLTIPTYVPANDEVVHPAVVNCGYRWNGYQYWMCITPYTDGNNDYENPSIYGSNDGINWVVPAGLTNPVVPWPTGSGYNADPFLFFENNTMYLGWMEYITSARIYLMQSLDGITWTNKTQIISTADGYYNSTTIIGSMLKVGATYYLYYVGRYPTEGGTHIMRRSAASPFGPFSAVVENIDFVPPAGLDWWHLSVKYFNGKYYILAQTSAKVLATGDSIYIGVSDDGIQFKRTSDALITKTETPETNGLYMPVFEQLLDKLRVYYSVYSNTNRWELMTAEMQFMNPDTAILSDGNTFGWYDSTDLTTITKDGSNLVSRWNDKLLSGRDLIQATAGKLPLLTEEGLLFDGVDDWMQTLTATLNQPTVIYLVIKQVGWTYLDRILDGFTANTGLIAQTATASAVEPKISIYSGSFSSPTQDLPVDAIGIIRVHFNGANGRLQVDRNVPLYGNYGAGNMAGLTIGSSSAGVNNANVVISEIIVRKQADTVQNEEYIYSYLKNKYAISKSNVIFDGDSLTFGFGSTGGQSYPKQLNDLFKAQNGITIGAYNYGVSGQRVDQMTADAVAQIDVLKNITHNILVVWGGVNDYAQAASVATILSRLNDYVTARKAAGWKVYVCTLLPHSSTAAPPPPAWLTDRILINDGIKSSIAAIADGIIDLASDAILGVEGVQNDLTYYTADKIHLTNAGYGRVAAFVKTVLDSVIEADKI